jgi:hypothetical protein
MPKITLEVFDGEYYDRAQKDPKYTTLCRDREVPVVPRVGERISYADTRKHPHIFCTLIVTEVLHMYSHYADTSLTPGPEEHIYVHTRFPEP